MSHDILHEKRGGVLRKQSTPKLKHKKSTSCTKTNQVQKHLFPPQTKADAIIMHHNAQTTKRRVPPREDVLPAKNSLTRALLAPPDEASDRAGLSLYNDLRPTLPQLLQRPAQLAVEVRLVPCVRSEVTARGLRHK